MKIRLTQKEVAEIVSVFSQFFDNEKVSLYLYGSRTKLDLKGGDIDLLLVFDDEDVKTRCHSKKTRHFSCDKRIYWRSKD